MTENIWNAPAGIVKLLNTELVYPRDQRDRLWVKAGCIMMLSKTQSIRMDVNRVEDCEYVPVAKLETSYRNCCRTRQLDLTESSCLDLSLEHGLIIIPRAMELDAAGRPCRLFIELIRTDQRYQNVVGEFAE